MIEETEIYKYFRTLNRIIPRDKLIVDRFGNRDVFISVTDTTYYIFDLEKFDILFVGPYIPRILSSSFYGDTLYISTGEKVKKYKRSACVGEIEKRNIKEMMCVGNILFLVDTTGVCTVVENECEARTLVDEGRTAHTPLEKIFTLPFKVTLLHHPYTYVNKLLVVQGDSTILYNFIKKKEIYKFKSLKKDILMIRNSKVVDVVGVGYEDRVEIVDLKKDKVLYIFPIKGIPKDIDFSSTRMLVVMNDTLLLFDLNDKRVILKKSQTLFSRFLDDNYLLHSSESSISILDSTLETIKRKSNCTRGILGVEVEDTNSFLVYTKGEVFKYNTGNTSTYQKYKFKGEIERFTFKEGVGAIYGKNILYRVGTSIKEILSTEVSLLASFRNICSILTGNILNVLNLNSRNVYRTIELDGPVKDIKMDSRSIYLLLKDRLRVISYQTYDMVEYEIPVGYTNLEVYESFQLIYSVVDDLDDGRNLKGNITNDNDINIKKDDDMTNDMTKSSTTSSTITLLVDGKPFRSFHSKGLISLDVSSDLKWLVYNTPTSIYILDILSGNTLDIIPCPSKVVRFSQDMLFLIVVTTRDDLVLLNNKTMFSPKRQAPSLSEARGIPQEGFLKTVKKQNGLYNELLLQRTLFNSGGERRDEDIVEKDVEKFEEEFKKFEENYLKAVGYLELENGKML